MVDSGCVREDADIWRAERKLRQNPGGNRAELQRQQRGVPGALQGQRSNCSAHMTDS